MFQGRKRVTPLRSLVVCPSALLPSRDCPHLVLGMDEDDRTQQREPRDSSSTPLDDMNSTRAATGLMKSPPVRPPESPSMVPDCPGLPPPARAILDNLIKVQMLDKSQVGL